jgi:hypothetical protein
MTSTEQRISRSTPEAGRLDRPRRLSALPDAHASLTSPGNAGRAKTSLHVESVLSTAGLALPPAWEAASEPHAGTVEQSMLLRSADTAHGDAAAFVFRRPPAGRSASELALARSPLPTATPSAEPSAAAASGFVSPTEPVVQRQEEAGAGEPAGSAPSAGSPPPAPAGGPGAEDLEALAGRLYERIRRRLRSELLLDRERSGLMTDRR